MSAAPVVVKFGGDALATPEHIAAAARRIAAQRSREPVVAVASARRGVTDHLLALAREVRARSGSAERARGARVLAATDRAVAAGEIVSASLLAAALGALGVDAVPLDAREAGLESDGRATRARLTAVRPRTIARLVARGVTPVVAGFQGWHRGRLTTLGRGGSDTTAVAVAAALGALRCDLVKEVGGLRTADPVLVPEARQIPAASHRFLVELAGAGAKVIHPAAAALAERHELPLRFTGLGGDDAASDVGAAAKGRRVEAISVRAGLAAIELQVPHAAGAALWDALARAAGDLSLAADMDLQEEAAGWHLHLLAPPDDLATCHAAVERLAGGAAASAPVLALSTVTVVAAPALPAGGTGPLYQAAHESGAHLLRVSQRHTRLTFVTPDADAIALARALHGALPAAVGQS